MAKDGRKSDDRTPPVDPRRGAGAADHKELVAAVRRALDEHRDKVEEDVALRVARMEKRSARATAVLSFAGVLVAALLGIVGGSLTPYVAEWAKSPDAKRKEGAEASVAKETAMQELEKRIGELETQSQHLGADLRTMQTARNEIPRADIQSAAVDGNAVERARLDALIAATKKKIASLQTRIEGLEAELHRVGNLTGPLDGVEGGGRRSPSEEDLLRAVEIRRQVAGAERELESAKASLARDEAKRMALADRSIPPGSPPSSAIAR